MYNCSAELNKYYREEVVLPEREQNNLREKRKINIKRLKNGIKKYNNDKNTAYKICEDRIQGSMAMHTVIQNDEHDYDIDVGIVFEQQNLNSLGSQATRNMVGNALKEEMYLFNTEPEIKTSCVRIKYSDGYHVDFAIYKRHKESEDDQNYRYKHAGAEWNNRDLNALTEWFKNEIKIKGEILRKVIRLSKTFCKSRDSWTNMPSGFIQTILCSELLATEYERLDKIFYYTMKNIVKRLENKLEVEAPIDDGRPLVTRNIDYTRMTNWKNRLDSKLNTLQIIFDSDCDSQKALKAWSDFFNNTFLEDLYKQTTSKDQEKLTYKNTEEFIDDKYVVLESFDVNIECMIIKDGFRKTSIQNFLEKNKFIPYNFKVNCKVGTTNCPDYDKVLWKVRNVGIEAEKQDCIRGQIYERGNEITEPTSFSGNHYIECYLIKNEICVGIGHIDIPIGEYL